MKKTLIWTLPLILLLACSTTAPNQAAETPTLAEASSPPTQEPPTTEPPTQQPPTLAATDTALPQPSDTPPPPLPKAAILFRTAEGSNTYILVGGTQNGFWADAGQMSTSLTAGQTFHFYQPTAFFGDAAAEGVMRDPLCNTNFVSFADLEGQTPLLGVSADWPVLPRTFDVFPNDTPVYLETVGGWLTDQAPSQPIPVINKIWRADLEGDGVDEVIIDASRFTEPSGHNVEPRDYSVILMRKVSGNDVVRLEIVGDYYGEAAENAFPLTYTLEFVGDLNGDGIMEIVVGVSRWEGMGVMVFEVQGLDVVLALSVMCSL